QLASRRWIWEQYDHLVGGHTIQRPGGDAAVVAIDGILGDGGRALAITTDCTPRYCVADPVEGGKQAVAEAWRNLTAVGAKPLAVTNNLNFGNPERPEIMGQLAGCVQGMGEACRALDFPVVSGNVSLYNETNGSAILPTPVIGGVGLIEDWRDSPRTALTRAGDTLIVIGETTGWLGASLYLREIAGREEGAAPPVDLEAERRNGDLVREMIGSGLVAACHDLSDGGLLVAVAEMAMAGTAGVTLQAPPGDFAPHAWYFGEDQARYLIATDRPAQLLDRSKSAGVPATAVGKTVAGRALTLSDGEPISLTHLSEAHEGWLPAYMTQRDEG
ncbi:MAG: AIR synthase related protein, partial [Bauldia litoralis]